MTCVFTCWSYIFLAGIGGGAGIVEEVRYLRPAQKQFATECDFTITRVGKGSVTESVTCRGKTKMIVTARHDDKDALTAAEVVLWTDNQKKSAVVRMVGGKAKVEREGFPVQEFDSPKGVIVTSAPDWTDTFLLCRRYDRKKGGKQTFPGLWIHPVEASQQLTFSIERQGAATIEHAGKQLKLDRYTIWLRGNSSYAAWADSAGRMIKLTPLPTKADATNWLVLSGYEKSASGLAPTP
jgi:hypothetical protein